MAKSGRPMLSNGTFTGLVLRGLVVAAVLQGGLALYGELDVPHALVEIGRAHV